MSPKKTSKNKSSQENIITKASKLIDLQSITIPIVLTSGIKQDIYQVSRLDLEINFSVEHNKVLCEKTRLTCLASVAVNLNRY